jgi:hypothetical protein
MSSSPPRGASGATRQACSSQRRAANRARAARPRLLRHMPLSTNPLRCASAKALPPARVSNRQTGRRVARALPCETHAAAAGAVGRDASGCGGGAAARSSRAAPRAAARRAATVAFRLRLLRRPPCVPLRRRCAARDAQGGERRTRTVAWWRESPAALAQVGGRGGACTQAGRRHAKCSVHSSVWGSTVVAADPAGAESVAASEEDAQQRRVRVRGAATRGRGAPACPRRVDAVHPGGRQPRHCVANRRLCRRSERRRRAGAPRRRLRLQPPLARVRPATAPAMASRRSAAALVCLGAGQAGRRGARPRQSALLASQAGAAAAAPAPPAPPGWRPPRRAGPTRTRLPTGDRSGGATAPPARSPPGGASRPAPPPRARARRRQASAPRAAPQPQLLQRGVAQAARQH